MKWCTIKRRFIVWWNIDSRSWLWKDIFREMDRADRQWEIRQRRKIYNLTDMD